MDYSCRFNDFFPDVYQQTDQNCIACDSCSDTQNGNSDSETKSSRKTQKGSGDPKPGSSSTKTSSGGNDQHLDKITKTHLKALDDLVHVNSLFSVAVFIGLSNTGSPNQTNTSLGYRRKCDPDATVAKTLVTCQVLSFAFFLVSSLSAKSLKVLLNIFQTEEKMETEVIVKYYCPSLTTLFRSRDWRRTILLISTVASAIGVFFLTLSTVSVVQIKLGKFSCGNFHTSISVLLLTGLIFVSLILYLSTMHYATFVRFGRSTKIEIESSSHIDDDDDTDDQVDSVDE